MVDLSSVVLKYTWIFTKRLVLFPRPKQPPTHIASGISPWDTGSDWRWGCLGLGTRLPSGHSNAAPPCLIIHVHSSAFNEWI